MDPIIKLRFAKLFVVLPVIGLIFLSVNSELLIPKGYQLAMDGYVISRTMVLIFTLYLITKLGYWMWERNEKH
ncbi:hypothetical protein RYX56_19065 [Alkalihalophilus lindianensis]|uniref:Uncharacterized protein n=1 Tax=Alkalihalophilus lindianensis TaxID=1630542 RepID=A0ABU3XGG1_9BACI|nr:hypothetical protein [Alkalihalophilus lindianensis]